MSNIGKVIEYYDIVCPYCNAKQNIDHDDGYGYEEDKIYEQECIECEKVFAFSTSVIYSYDAWKADCLNGGEHKLEKIIGYPEELFVNKYRCKVCGIEIEKEDEDGS